jgi:general secretion pathway protein B
MSAYERQRQRMQAIETERAKREAADAGAAPAPSPAAAAGTKPHSAAVATPPPKPVAPVAKAKPAAPKPSAGPPLPYIWEMPFAERKALPPLVISMHVFSDDPAGRFVVIDGERYEEGEEIGPDLTIGPIRRDGVVLNAKGKSYLLPRGGR